MYRAHIDVNGEMWRYQKPGFAALLLAELQRQQQCSQFCDTLLMTEGVSVPAHSCILSAISPQMSLALASSPPPPAGQSRLLEFRALGAGSLLHVVRLLYCGEMAGEGGEAEKREAISAAATLGIHGLVEVTKRDRGARNEEEWRTEAGVQTEPEKEGSLGRWWREVTDGCTFPWKETPSNGKKDTWTQTEPPAEPAAIFETIDMTALQCLGQTDSHPAHPHMSYIPISLVYPPEENQTRQPSPALTDSMHESTAAGHTAVAPPHTFVAPGAADLQGVATGDVAAFEAWGDEPLERFQDNIPAYISYFLNPDKEEALGGGRPRKPGAAAGSARRAGTGERRARRPQARRRGAGRRGLTQTVDVQEVVVVSKLQKLWLQRWGPTRAGQGGGAVGRKLSLETRELLKSTKSVHGRKGRGKMWSGDVPPRGKGGGGATQRRKDAALQFNQPEQFDRLLEEVMMGLDILPTDSSAAHAQPAPPAGSSGYASCGDTFLVQNRKCTAGLLEASPGCRGSARVAAKARGDDVGSSGERKGEINEMLDHFLQSFEQPGDGCAAREVAAAGRPYTGPSTCRKDKKRLPRCSRPCEAPAPARNPEGAPTKQRRKRRKIERPPFSVEKKKARKPKTNDVREDREDRKLQQRPVVRLGRRGHRSADVTPRKCSCPDAKDSSPCGADEQREEDQERKCREYGVKPQEEEAEGAPKVGGKRRAEEEEEATSDEAKRIRFKQTARCMCDTRVPSSPSADLVSELVPLTGIRDRLQVEDGEKKTAWRELHLRQTEERSMDEETETMDVDGDPEDDGGGRRPSRRAYTLSCLVMGTSSDSPSSCSEREDRLRSTGRREEDKDEDIDVIGGSSPVAEPVVISWTESSEEEDIDVVGEKTAVKQDKTCVHIKTV